MAINTVSDRIAIRNWVSNKMLLTGIAQQSLDQVVVENDLDKRVNLYNVWLQIISNYTERKLTFQSDILAAVAGVASILQAYLGDRYLAGLFEGDLLRSLLWRVTDPSVASSSSYGAPSWSWASLVGAVRPEVGVDNNLITPRIVGHLKARVISAETYLNDILTAPINHFLDVSGGQLQLEGYLLRGKSLANLRYKSEDLDLIKRDPVDPSRAYAQQPSLYLDLSGDLDEPHDVAILHIGVWEWRLEHRNIPTRVETKSAGLILRMIDSTRSLCRRIGVAAMRIGNLNVEQSCRFQEEAESMITSEWMKTVVTIT